MIEITAKSFAILQRYRFWCTAPPPNNNLRCYCLLLSALLCVVVGGGARINVAKWKKLSFTTL